MHSIEGRVYRVWGTGNARSTAVLNGQTDNVVYLVHWTDDEHDVARRVFDGIGPDSNVFKGTWERKLQDHNGRYAIEFRLCHDNKTIESKVETIPRHLY